MNEDCCKFFFLVCRFMMTFLHFENILSMKYTSETTVACGSDSSSLLARFTGATSYYKLTAMIMCRSDGELRNRENI